MRGGIHQIIGHCCMRRFVSKANVGIFCALVVLTTCPSHADEGYGDDDCPTKAPPEQSIIVSTDQTLQGASTIFVATDKEEESLQPIANVSQYIPDLAEPENAAPVPEVALVEAEGAREGHPSCEVDAVARRERGVRCSGEGSPRGRSASAPAAAGRPGAPRSRLREPPALPRRPRPAQALRRAHCR